MTRTNGNGTANLAPRRWEVKLTLYRLTYLKIIKNIHCLFLTFVRSRFILSGCIHVHSTLGLAFLTRFILSWIATSPGAIFLIKPASSLHPFIYPLTGTDFRMLVPRSNLTFAATVPLVATTRAHKLCCAFMASLTSRRTVSVFSSIPSA